MVDIFLSYSAQDLKRAVQLAEFLEHQGWSVWWDREVPVGRAFDEIIEEALNNAACVIVLWSRASVGSRWVAAEADAAIQQGKLLPVFIESVKLPLGFRQIQTADLSNWSGNSSDPDLQQLVGGIRSLVGAPQKRQPEIALDIADFFLSYSREDDPYVTKLLVHLRKEGLSVWADDQIHYGDRWWKTIVANIRNCAGMIVVMTPASEESKWVEREILFADEENKPIFPLLLEGRRFPLLVGVQYHDVTGGKMPPRLFADSLKQLAERRRAV